MMRRLTTAGTLSLLALLLACGGGAPEIKPPAAASRLEYTNPNATPSDWRLELDSGQGTSRLVLRLMGPAGLSTRGVSFFLTCPGSQAQWAQVQPGAALDLGAEPRIYRAKEGASTADLQVGLYQKGHSTTLGSAPLALVVLELKSGAAPGAVSLTATPGKTPVHLDATGQVQSLPAIRLGTLMAR